MALMKKSVAVRNAAIDAEEAAVGPAPLLEGFTGAAPALITDPDSGTKLFSGTLPSDWLSSASGGVKSGLSLPWSMGNALATGALGYCRLKNAAGSTVHYQLSASVTGGGGEIQFATLDLVQGQPIAVTACSYTAGG